MTVKAFHCEEALSVEGELLRLTLNFKAIDAIESLLGEPFSAVIDELNKREQRLGVVGKVLWGLLREHHPEMTLDQAASLMFGGTGLLVGSAVTRLLESAFPAGDPKAKGKNPPKRRGASKTS